MIRNLVPEFITENFERKRLKGSFNAYAMFVDISGFTELTNSLLENGREGVEVLCEIINNIFSPAISIIINSFGFVSTFGGDSFTALFPENDVSPLMVTTSAKSIRELFQEKGLQRTKYGDYNLKVKIGISFGNIDWGIITNNKQNSFFFKGIAINRSVLCEKQCKRLGDHQNIIVDSDLEMVIEKSADKDKIIYAKAGEEFFCLQETNHTIIRERVRLTSSADESSFIPESILRLKDKGEFRHVVSCFISFAEEDDFIERISQVIDFTYQYGGYFNRVSFGDKGNFLLVFFGAPLTQENLISKALDFALTVINMKGFSVKIGVTFANAFTGFIGSDEQQEYTCNSFKVNLAARLMLLAENSGILTDDTIYLKSNNDYDFTKHEAYLFKGFYNALNYYSLLEKKSFRRENSAYHEFIGRNKEMSELRNRVEKLFAVNCAGLINITGVAGIGKSRLIKEFSAEVANRVRWIATSCHERIRSGLYPFKSLLLDFFQLETETTLNEKREKFNQKFNELMEKSPDPTPQTDSKFRKPYLERFLGINDNDDTLKLLSGKELSERTINAVKDILRIISGREPMIIVIEDSHWIDYESMILLKRIMFSLTDYPLLILLSSREKYISLNSETDIEEIIHIELGRLSDEDSISMISSLTEFYGISPDKNSLIHQRSEGNPFYIEQIVFFYRDILKSRNSENHHPLENVELPFDISAIIIARFDRMPPELKEIAQTASVIGRKFPVNLLSEMFPGKDLRPLLELGRKERIWYEDEQNYYFEHALIRDAIYDMQLKSKLRKTHQSAAETIETLSDDTTSFYYDLAYHYSHSDVTDKAKYYLIRAADQAMSVYGNHQALAFYNQYLDNYQPLGSQEVIHANLMIGKIYQHTGKWDLAGEKFRFCEKEAEEMGLSDLLAQVLGELGWHYSQKNLYDDALKCFFNKIKINEQMKVFTEIAASYGNIGVVYKRMGNLEKATEYYLKQMEICIELDNSRGLATVYGNMASVKILQGDLQEALNLYEKQIRISEETNLKSGLQIGFGGKGLVYYYKQDLPEARFYLEKQISISYEIGDQTGIISAMGNLGLIQKESGNYEEAWQTFNNVLRLCRESGDEKGEAISYSNLANLCLLRNDLEESIAYYTRYLKSAEKIKDNEMLSIAYGNIGLTLSRKKDYQTALIYYDKGLELDYKLGLKLYLPQDILAKTECLFLMGKYAEIDSLVEEALKIATETDNHQYDFNLKYFGRLAALKLNYYDLKRRSALINHFTMLLTETDIDEEKAIIYYSLAEIKSESGEDFSFEKDAALKLYCSSDNDADREKIIKLESMC